MRPDPEILASPAMRQFFGTRLTPMSFQGWIEGIGNTLASGRRGYLSACHNLHSLYMLHTEPGFRAFYERSDECYIDGMAIRAVLAGAGVTSGSEQRFSLMDTFEQLLAHAEQHNWTIFYLGSQELVIQQAREQIDRSYPDLNISLHHGYFENDALVVNSINAVCPDLLLVGMGMPAQETWLLEQLDKLDVGVATEVGATLDYFTGAQAKPPLWLSRIGLAWLYRLLHDPVRLWRRYLLEPWVLLLPTIKLWLRR